MRFVFHRYKISIPHIRLINIIFINLIIPLINYRRFIDIVTAIFSFFLYIIDWFSARVICLLAATSDLANSEPFSVKFLAHPYIWCYYHAVLRNYVNYHTVPRLMMRAEERVDCREKIFSSFVFDFNWGFRYGASVI